MATLYFNNTASMGDGSLRAALTAAAPGDVVMPDPTVFGVGEQFRINVSPFIAPAASTTIDAGSTRPILETDSSLLIRTEATCAEFNVVGFTLKGRVIIQAAAEAPVKASFTRCVFGSNSLPNYLLQAGSGYTTIECDDCLFTGSLTGVIYLSAPAGVDDKTLKATFNRCTIAGNVGATFTGNAADNVVLTNCIDGADLSAGGFANAPTTMEGYSVDNLPPWETWNWAPLPESRYSVGATGVEGTDDLLGNRRGWKKNGRAAYALGAIEVVDADYFLAAEAQEAANFLDPASWSTSRGKYTAPDAISAGVFYIGHNASLSGFPPPKSSIALQGSTALKIGSGGVLEALKTGRNCTVTIQEESAILAVGDFQLGEGTALSAPNGATLAVTGLSALEGADVQGFTLSAFCGETRAVTARISGNRATVSYEMAGDYGVPAKTVEFSLAPAYDQWVVVEASDGALTLHSAKAHKFRVYNGEEWIISDPVPRIYYYNGAPESGSFTEPNDWALDKQRTIICNDAPTIAGGVFDCRS